MGWNRCRVVKEIASSFPCFPVNCECSKKRTRTEKKAKFDSNPWENKGKSCFFDFWHLIAEREEWIIFFVTYISCENQKKSLNCYLIFWKICCSNLLIKGKYIDFPQEIASQFANAGTSTRNGAVILANPRFSSLVFNIQCLFWLYWKTNSLMHSTK